MRRRVDLRGLLFDGVERLVRFVESEWPPVSGECLESYICHRLLGRCPMPSLARGAGRRPCPDRRRFGDDGQASALRRP